MDIRCPRCGCEAVPAGHEDARAYYQCPKCNRVWATTLASLSGRKDPRSRRGSIRVLVVDDSNELTGLVAIWLEEEGYAVVTATSGREALDAAAVYYPISFCWILIMPPPDGFAVCAALRNSAPSASDPHDRPVGHRARPARTRPWRRRAAPKATDARDGRRRGHRRGRAMPPRSFLEAALAFRHASQSLESNC